VNRAHLGSLLLEFLDGALVNTAALVDQVTGSSGFSGIDVTDDDERRRNT
jgi:sugar/nucleoside kinase (ribokinase family)